MTLTEIYAEFTPGSTGFAQAVWSHCGFAISLDEIKRIGAAAQSAEEFQRIWENEDWWVDEKQ